MKTRYSPLYEAIRTQEFPIRPEIIDCRKVDLKEEDIEENEFVISIEGNENESDLYVNCINPLSRDGICWWSLVESPIIVPDEILAQAIFLGWGQRKFQNYKDMLSRINKGERI